MTQRFRFPPLPQPSDVRCLLGITWHCLRGNRMKLLLPLNLYRGLIMRKEVGTRVKYCLAFGVMYTPTQQGCLVRLLFQTVKMCPRRQKWWVKYVVVISATCDSVHVSLSRPGKTRHWHMPWEGVSMGAYCPRKKSSGMTKILAFIL